MKHSPNKLWVFGLPLSLIVLAMAYYIKVPSFREFVDARVPFVHEMMAPFVRQPTVGIIDGRKTATQRAAVISSPAPALPDPPPPAQATAPALKPPKPDAEGLPVPRDDESDLRTLLTDRTCWPKVVTLKRSVEFPAVSGGKVIGKLTAPQGALANLVTVRDGKLAVEYHGGGAWLDVRDTDALARVRAAHSR